MLLVAKSKTGQFGVNVRAVSSTSKGANVADYQVTSVSMLKMATDGLRIARWINIALPTLRIFSLRIDQLLSSEDCFLYKMAREVFSSVYIMVSQRSCAAWSEKHRPHCLMFCCDAE